MTRTQGNAPDGQDIVTTAITPEAAPKLTFGPDNYINREVSWLDFNTRVLEEAEDPENPLLERVKFLTIVSSNLDEFFMVRVAGLREQAFGDGVPDDFTPDGLRAEEQLRLIADRTQKLVAQQYRCFNEMLVPELALQGIKLIHPPELTEREKTGLDRFFRERVFPVLTPMAIDPSHPSPLYHNRALYLATILERKSGLGPKRLFAVVQLPTLLPRLVPLEGEPGHRFLLLEEAIAARLPELFGACEVLSWTTFRITRDSDVEVLEQESDDLLQLIEDRLKARRRGDDVRLEVNAGATPDLIARIVESEDIRDDDAYREVYRVAGPVDLTGMAQLTRVVGFDSLRDPPFMPRISRGLSRRVGQDLFAAIRQGDILLHHPFDAFDPVIDFIQRAAQDPKVLAIKQTLYRTGSDSPIIKSLMQAAENGKHVTALVELKARFDEETNVGWARELERAGVHVVFGFLDLKTHCKLSLVVRQEGDGLRRYVHISTGNYNRTTARLYTDVALFTANDEIAADASALFNLLTGYTQGHTWTQLVVAPDDLHRRTIELIEEQSKRAKDGKGAWIFAKLNALVDHQVIEALYKASQAGVPIDLVIRGICCLRPGIPGLSENIRVRSIVDRFLEHSRILVFGSKDDQKMYFTSADWMPRNFFRRVEVMFPVVSEEIKERLRTELIPAYLRDNVKARQLQSDGKYVKLKPATGEPKYRVQQELLDVNRNMALPPVANPNSAMKRRKDRKGKSH